AHRRAVVARCAFAGCGHGAEMKLRRGIAMYRRLEPPAPCLRQIPCDAFAASIEEPEVDLRGGVSACRCRFPVRNGALAAQRNAVAGRVGGAEAEERARVPTARECLP